MEIVLIIIVGLAGFVVGRMSAGRRVPLSLATEEGRAEMHSASREALSARTEDRKEAIIEMMQEEARHEAELRACKIEYEPRTITRRDVEELLEVSDETALRYLDELEAEGHIRQEGVGKGVHYVLSK